MTQAQGDYSWDGNASDPVHLASTSSAGYDTNTLNAFVTQLHTDLVNDLKTFSTYTGGEKYFQVCYGNNKLNITEIGATTTTTSGVEDFNITAGSTTVDLLTMLKSGNNGISDVGGAYFCIALYGQNGLNISLPGVFGNGG